MIHPLRKLPRGQLYFDPALVAIQTLRHAFGPMRAGARVRELERRFADTVGTRHGIALPHARVGVLQVLKAMDLPAGGEVLTTPVTVPEVIHAIELAGLRPRFVDLGERTGQVDVAALRGALNNRSCALMITHLCGLVCDMGPILELAGRHGLPVIEDASQALGARWQGRMAGSIGVAGVFSISTLKPVSSFHGGLVVTDDDRLASRLQAAADALPPRSRRTLPAWLARDYSLHLASSPALLGSLGWPLLRWSERRAPDALDAFHRGGLWRGDDPPGAALDGDTVPRAWQVSYSDYQAELAIAALGHLAEGTTRRRRLARLLMAELQARDVTGLPRIVAGTEPAFWRLPLWASDVPTMRSGLAARGVDSTTTNLACCSREPHLAHLAADTPHARAFVDRALFLPLHPTLRASDMVHVAAAVADTLADRSLARRS